MKFAKMAIYGLFAAFWVHQDEITPYNSCENDTSIQMISDCIASNQNFLGAIPIIANLMNAALANIAHYREGKLSKFSMFPFRVKLIE